MNDDKTVVNVRPRRPHLKPEERERAVALWMQSGRSTREVARELGISRQSLARWKQGTRASAVNAAAEPALVEVPAPVSGAGVAEVMTRGGAVRFLAPASPVWAAELIRELNRC
ncbi:MAG: transposase [Opitutaceae bacterium]|nr:transposase [Opitutaceae bacterium]